MRVESAPGWLQAPRNECDRRLRFPPRAAGVLSLLLPFAAAAGPAAPAGEETGGLQFRRDIQPILEERPEFAEQLATLAAERKHQLDQLTEKAAADAGKSTEERDYSTLLDELHDRGLLKNTMVLAMGEFGRTPKINPAGGRDQRRYQGGQD